MCVGVDDFPQIPHLVQTLGPRITPAEMPFLGILEDKKLPHVPGTVILGDETIRSDDLVGALKHGTGRNSHVILVPQPSNDPNDPLNWPQWKKVASFGITCWGTLLYGAVSIAMLNPALYAMSVQLEVSITAMVLTAGYQTLVTGVSGPIFAALARKYGKRPMFLFASLVCLVGNIVGSAVPTYQGVLASRILQGFSIAPYESLIFDMLSDMFFLHERGVYTALVNFCLVGVSNITAVVSGPIVTNLGWRWLYYLITIFGVAQLILQFLFVPETTYIRASIYDIDSNVSENLDELVELETKEAMRDEKYADRAIHDEGRRIVPTISRESQEPPPLKKTFVQNLAILNGTFSNENLLQAFIAPFLVAVNLSVLWVLIVNSMFIVLYVVIALVIAQEFGPPPYLLSASSIGLLSLGPFVGGVVGAIFMALASDPFIKWCAGRNNGIFEPEYRLIPCIFGLCTGAGLLGWGFMVADYVSPVATATMHGLVVFGALITAVATSNYAIDAYRSLTAEIFIASMAVKNIIIFGFTYFVNDWTAQTGVRHAFVVWSVVGFALLATTPFMYVLGKKYRSYWARNNLLEKWSIVSRGGSG
ncbi:hypothetical protein D6D20_09455 [Aureobasidium pullulans]|uniref:Major facilitator superfamily (MFS) profile domain-containing protein n=1 Tax=Aureobasidium pullulans TaxID=5580 RepID=A0A4S8YLJ0_AURPU|nr:hypothetical protein D6D20_09455 [Aureobasidium pullulans]